MYRITFYVPQTHLETTKQALFNVGVGKIAPYDHCCWQTLGTGQFRPLPGSSPSLGEKNKICTEPEYKVEMVCEDSIILIALETLIKYHPYQKPAYEAYKIITLNDLE